jgi:phosphoglycerate dehydrogenase-like enzyme
MPDCLIVTALAREFAGEIARSAGFPIDITACTTAEQARAEYAGETILFGNPAMIAEILPDLPNVRWVQSSWAGVTPLMQLGRRDYVLTGIKDVFGPQMSEYVFGYLLAHELRILQRAAAQRGHQWFNEASGMLHGKRLGIMGTGSIGRHIARTAACFQQVVTGLSRSGRAVPGFDKVLPVEQLHAFLEGTDYLVAVLPQTKATDNLLDATALAHLPQHAYFVNVGRSNVVDADALMTALRNEKIAGAALDVFDEEPLPANSPLWDTPNLAVTAHIAALSHPLLIVPIFVDNYRRYTSNQKLRYEIDFASGY